MKVPAYEAAAIAMGFISIGLILTAIIVFICWKFPFCRSRTFWDKHAKRIFRKIYNKLHKVREKPEDTQNLVLGPLLRKRQSEQTPFSIPQIYVDYGSRRTSYASDNMRRFSVESGSSKRTSIASSLDTDRRGSGSSLSSRRTSFASDADRRGSSGSACSRRTSLLSSDCPSRRGSGSSKSFSSRKSSDASRFGNDSLADNSDSEAALEEEYMAELETKEPRRSSLEESVSKSTPDKDLQRPPYYRSYSLAEIGRPTHVFLPEGRDRRKSSLAICSTTPSSPTGNPSQKKKSKHNRQAGIGLPNRPVVMHDLNLDDITIPRWALPLLPTGKLKVQLMFAEDRRTLTVIIIEAEDLRLPGQPEESEINAFVKAILKPGKTFKYKTSTKQKCKKPLFLEKFVITDIVPSEITDESAIEFQVFSVSHVTRRYLVGVTSISFREIETLENGLKEMIIMPVTNEKIHQGDLRISGCFQPVAGKIVFNVLEARNLPRLSLLGAVNPYVKVEMYVNEMREAKNKTKVRQNTQDPVWNHQCVFEINRENPKLFGHNFLFEVIHRDMMMGMQKIGSVSLGWYSDEKLYEHWREIMEHPHRPTDYWHPIIKTVKMAS